MVIVVMIGAVIFSTITAVAKPAKSARQAQGVKQYRLANFKLIKSNVGALGAMNKGTILFSVQTIQTNSLRIEQLSLMLEDNFTTDTTSLMLRQKR